MHVAVVHGQKSYRRALHLKRPQKKTSREIIQDLLLNDPRNKHEQVWTLENMKKKRG